MWANDQKFQCVLTIADPRVPDKKLAWLDDDEDIDHLRVEAEVRESSNWFVLCVEALVPNLVDTRGTRCKLIHLAQAPETNCNGIGYDMLL